jgi:hypothetical protein
MWPKLLVSVLDFIRFHRQNRCGAFFSSLLTVRYENTKTILLLRTYFKVARCIWLPGNSLSVSG